MSNNSSNYNSSGIPYILTFTAPISGSTMLYIELPSIPKFVVYRNNINYGTTSNKILVGYSDTCMDSGSYILLDNEERFMSLAKERNIYISAFGATESSGSIIAGLIG